MVKEKKPYIIRAYLVIQYNNLIKGEGIKENIVAAKLTRAAAENISSNLPNSKVISLKVTK